MNFTELPLADEVLDALDAMRFTTCTPIQEQSIPPIMEGRDLLGVAQTGTGKTAAYLLPILSKLNSGEYPQNHINCLIMCPTRELAQQIDQQVEAFSYYMPVPGVAVYGGNDGIRYEQEKNGLRLGADIVTATPGRLLSHIATGNVDLSQLSFFVLDEADRMLDMGFYDDIIKIVAQLPEKRQTILFSATMPQNIQTLAKNILHDPVEIKIAVAKPVEKIHQMAYVCYEPMKDKILIDLLTKEQMDRVILFVSSKLKVKEITRMLKMRKMDAECMHSDLTQAERDEIMLRFKNRHISILVATDIVARGIDIDDIQTVINYDVPHDGEDYIHRIGRTARANREGEAITLVSPNDIVYMQRIERLMEREIEKPQLPEGCFESPEYIASRGGRSGNDRGRGGRNRHGRHRGNRGNAHDGSHKNGELANKHKSSQKSQNLPPKSESQAANSPSKTNKRRHRANNKPTAKTEPQTPKE
jgi:superfamily II DNA/RNA helicase